MFRFVNEERVLPFESGSGLTLVGAETSVIGKTAWFGGGASYTRPVRVEIDGGKAIRVRDHLMIVRLAMVVVVLVLTVWRLVDDRKH